MKKTASRLRNRKKPNDKLVALTLKLDSETYVRLSTFRAKERKTAQEILTEALGVYLDQMGG